MFTKRPAAVLFLGILGLAACKGGELEQPEAFCTSFGSGAAASWTCTNCTVASQGAVIDRNLDTASGITPNGGTTGASAVLLATSTADIASGGTVGVWVTQPANLASTVNELRTLKDNVEQEVLTQQNQVVLSAGRGTAAAGYIGMRTTKAFDAVEFTTTNTWSAGQAPVYQVYEICSDGGNA